MVTTNLDILDVNTPQQFIFCFSTSPSLLP